MLWVFAECVCFNVRICVSVCDTHCITYVLYTVFGVSLSKPHTYVKYNERVCIYIYMSIIRPFRPRGQFMPGAKWTKWLPFALPLRATQILAVDNLLLYCINYYYTLHTYIIHNLYTIIYYYTLHSLNISTSLSPHHRPTNSGEPPPNTQQR